MVGWGSGLSWSTFEDQSSLDPLVPRFLYSRGETIALQGRISLAFLAKIIRPHARMLNMSRG